MRTKALLCAATMVAGAITAMAQSNVYSLNIVGYVNIVLPANNTALISNPLDNTNSDLNTILPTAPNGTTVQIWNVANQDFETTNPRYSTSQGKWNPDPTIAPGQAFFISPAGKSFTNTFVGQVRTGSSTNVVPANNSVLVASILPIGGDLNSAWSTGTNVLYGYAPRNGDTIQTWNADPDVQDFDTTNPRYSTSQGKWNPNHVFNVGDGFFLLRAGGGDTNWVVNFTVQ